MASRLAGAKPLICIIAGLLLIRPLARNFSEILIIQKMHLNMSRKLSQFCLALNVFNWNEPANLHKV